MYDEDATLFGLGAVSLGSVVLELGLLAVVVPAVAVASLLVYRALSGWGG